MAVGSLDNETVNLVPDLLKMSQDANMPIFRLVDWTLVSKRVGEDKMNDGQRFKDNEKK